MWEDRWLGLVLSLWMLGCAGMSGSFALYSPLIKDIGDYDQTQMGALAAAKDLGEALGILPGLLCDMLPPWVLLLVGASHFLLGFGTLWAVCSGIVTAPNFLQMSIILIIASQGTAWFNTAALVTCVRNFPKSRGTVVGLLKSLVGLSSAIYTQLYSVLLAPNQAGFLGLLSVLPMAVVLPSMMFLRPAHTRPSDTPEKEARNLKLLMASCLGLAFYLTVINIFQEAAPNHNQVKLVTLLGVATFLILPLWVPFSYWREERKWTHSTIQECCQGVPQTPPIVITQHSTNLTLEQPLLQRTESVDSIFFDLSPRAQGPNPQPDWQEPGASLEEVQNPSSPACQVDCARGSYPDAGLPQSSKRLDSTSSILSSSAPPAHGLAQNGIGVKDMRQRAPRDILVKRRSSKILLAVSEGAVRGNKKKGPRRGEDFKVSEAVWKADFWLLAMGFMCGCGTALAAINNLAQMGLAQGYQNVRVFVSLVSIWSFVGRLGGGYLSEELVRSFAIPRPLVLLSAQLVMCIGHVCFAIAFAESLHVGCILIGLGYGVHWSIMPATVSGLFGLMHFGMLFNTVAATMPLGSYIFSSLIAGSLYDREVQHHHGSSTSIQGKIPFHITSGARAECLGAHCFRDVFLCMFVACLVGCFLNLILVLRTRRVYRTLYGGFNTSAPA